ncbi:MAG: S-methyl-5'-thioinosine phosphorylase [Methylophilaceae bacterium]
MFGIIGGTGLVSMKDLITEQEKVIETPYGNPSGALVFGMLGKIKIVFLARHGQDHSIPPHLINYQANLWALHSVGIKNIIAVSTVGSIDTKLMPGIIVFPSQIIDYTHNRIHTFFDGVDHPVDHIDFTYPYHEELRHVFIQSASKIKTPYCEDGIYAATQGPRLETAAEINRYEKDGATIVGMTGMPEAALAKELGINYAAICPVANHAAGRGLSEKGVTHQEINVNSEKIMKNVINLLKNIIELHGH